MNEEILPMLSNRLQYLLPENLIPMVSALVSRNLRQDSRFKGYCPQLAKLNLAVAEMIKLNRDNSDWFLLTHHRSMRPKSQHKLPVQETNIIDKKNIVKEKLSEKPILIEQEESFANDYMNIITSTRLLNEDEISKEGVSKFVKNPNEKDNFIQETNNLFKNCKMTVYEHLPLINDEDVEILQNKSLLNKNKLLLIRDKNDTLNGFNEIQMDSGIFETTSQENFHKLSNDFSNNLKQPNIDEQECNEKNKSFKNNNMESGMIMESDLQVPHMVSTS